MPDSVDIFGRNAHKGMGYGLPVERLNFSCIPYRDRDIDLLVSSSIGEENFAFTIETLLLIKKNYPDKRIVYSLNGDHKDKVKPYENYGIEFFQSSRSKSLIHCLPYAKVYFNPECRPRGGRAILEAFYCRTPFISSDLTVFSKAFPQYTYNVMHMTKISDMFGEILEADYAKIIKQAEENMEEEYWDNFFPKLEKRLEES
jgi:hypothetical protein